jgi:hypothetical protein
VTGFERATVALIYNLYYSRSIYSSGKPIGNTGFTVATYNESNVLKVQRYFKVRELTKSSIDISLEEGNRYRVYNSSPIAKHGCTIETEERQREKIEIENLDSSRAEGLAAKYRFTAESYSYDTVVIRDDEHGKRYTYKITG